MSGHLDIDDVARAKNALFMISPDLPHAEWVKVGMGAHAAGLEFEDFDAWSSVGGTYNASAARVAWRSFRDDGGIGAGTLFHIAKEHGWKSDAPRAKLSKDQLDAQRAQRAESARRAADRKLKEEQAAAARAVAIWNAATPVLEHAYLDRKRIKPNGARFASVWTKEFVDPDTGEVHVSRYRDALLVPIWSGPKNLVSLQAIFGTKCIGPKDRARDKDFLADGRLGGCYCLVGTVNTGTKTVIVCEGFATACSLHESTGLPVMAALSAGNIAKVAEVVQTKLPEARIIVAADNDLHRPENTGVATAKSVAAAVDGLVAVPVPSTPWDEKFDFNDLFVAEGADAVWAAVDAAMSTPKAAESAPAVERRTIVVVPGELPRVVDSAEMALLDHAHDLFVRAGQIVRPVREHVEASHGQRALVPRLHPLGKHAMVEALTAVADWTKPDARRKDGEVSRINAPLQVAETLLARGQWRLRPLTAIINSPTLRRDGTPIEVAGYDSLTGLLLEPTAKFGPVPYRPTQADARAALDRLGSLVAEFPFVAPEDRAVWLAAVLTSCVRRSLPSAPMFAFSAPTAGSGKSLLVDLCAIIATGSRAPVFAQGRSEEESEKRLASALLAGHGVVTIDNCTLPIDGDLLCQAMTQPELNIRPLGGSTVRIVPTSAAFFATGNSLVIAGDMTRRTLLCSLDPGEERPELRRFSFDPIERAEANRAGFLIDALTVLRAFHVAGCPTQRVARLGSFEAWSDLVRGALLWLGVEDPVRTMEKTRKSDPKLAGLRSVLSEWNAAFGMKPVRVREVIDAAVELDPASGGFGSRSEFTRPDFREALLMVAGSGGVISSRALGTWIAANRDRIVGGRRLQHCGNHRDGVAMWCVEETSPI